MKLKLAAAALLACAAFSASADDQTVNITAGTTYQFLADTNVLAGGDDVITFAGLANGWYQAYVTYSGNFVDITSASLNGQAPVSITSSVPLSTGAFAITDSSPFTLHLWGTSSGNGLAKYSGQVTVFPVPEPETYAMMLGGLALLGALAPRKKRS